MQLTHPLDNILNNEAKVRALRILCDAHGELSGRQIAKTAKVTPKTAHVILQGFIKEGLLSMRVVGKTYLFRLNENKKISGLLKDLFAEEAALSGQLLEEIVKSLKHSSLKDVILSVVLFGSIYVKTEGPSSDIDLLVIVKTAEDKKKVEDFFFQIDESISSKWGNPIAPYVNSLLEFRSKAKKKEGVIQDILKSHQLIYGDRLEKLLR